MAMLSEGRAPKEGSGLEVVVGNILDRSSLTPSLFQVGLVVHWLIDYLGVVLIGLFITK